MRVAAVSWILIVLIVLTGGSVAAQTPNQGLISVESAYSVDETVSRLQTTLADRGLIVVTTVNHAANAANVNAELRPTQLIVFGNPNIGTPLMQSSQTTAIDLPQKFLVWEDAAGVVRVTYNDPQYLAGRHSITGEDERLNQVATALNNFAQSVAPAAEAPAPEETAAPEAGAPAPDPTPVAEAPATLPATGGSGGAFIWLAAIAGGLLLVGGLLLWRARRSGMLLLLVGLSVLALGALNTPVAAQPSVPGLVSVASPYSVDETVSRVQNVLDENGLIQVATINHAANAANVGLELRPTQLVIFGNPAVGTQLMQSNQTIGIDLPQKLLVWEDESGQVWLAYNDPQFLADRHGITDRGELIGNISTALGNLAGAATAE